MTQENEMGALLPCPFCGGKGHSNYVRDGRRINCGTCGGAGPSEFHGPLGMPSAEKRAVAAWNRRAPRPALEASASDARREALEEAAKVVETFPADVMRLYDRPGGPPGNIITPSTFGDVADAIRALSAPMEQGEGT